MTLNENWYKTLDCQGRNGVYCKTIITEHFIGNHHTCEYSIVENKTNDIKQHCEFATMGKEQLSPRLHNIGNIRRVRCRISHGWTFHRSTGSCCFSGVENVYFII